MRIARFLHGRALMRHNSEMTVTAAMQLQRPFQVSLCPLWVGAHDPPRVAVPRRWTRRCSENACTIKNHARGSIDGDNDAPSSRGRERLRLSAKKGFDSGGTCAAVIFIYAAWAHRSHSMKPSSGAYSSSSSSIPRWTPFVLPISEGLNLAQYC